jgi:hypothetical protein
MTARLFRANTLREKAKGRALAPGLHISNLVAGVGFEPTTFGPESRDFCGTRIKKDSPFFLWAHTRGNRKRPGTCARPVKLQMVAGVGFEPTTFGL